MKKRFIERNGGMIVDTQTGSVVVYINLSEISAYQGQLAMNVALYSLNSVTPYWDAPTQDPGQAAGKSH